MSLIHLHLNRLGHLELAFVNQRILRRLVELVMRNGGPSESTAYLQHDQDVSTLLGELSPRNRRDLENGWDIRVRMDGWVAAHYYGYDAHRVFEQPR